MNTRPNILFLMCDEHRADVSGYEGNDIIKTPVIDKLAETGVAFVNAYAPAPICVPGRQCMVAGQLPKTCKCEVFGEDLEPGYLTFPRVFSRYGYATVACGKLHHMGTDQMQGWTHRIGADMVVETRYIDDKIHEEFKKFDRGRNMWPDAKEIRRAGIGYSPWQKRDDLAILGALNYIDFHYTDPFYNKANVKRPLLLKVSLNDPHFPYLTDYDKFTYYLNRVEPYLDQPASEHPYLSKRKVEIGVDVSEEEIRRATAAYYGMIEQADTKFGIVMDALGHAGQNLDDWIIIYTADHGEMLGEHGIWEKKKFYEASARVPLIIRWPKGFEGGKVIRENVNLCDIFATLCDLCDIPIPNGLDSRSLKPLITGENCCWNNETISQFNRDYLMIKWDHLKYQYYGVDMPEVLFDLKKNCAETIDYINDPEYKDIARKFRQRKAELGFGPNALCNYVNAGY